MHLCLNMPYFYLVIHKLITQYTVHIHSHRETVVSSLSEPKMGCESSQSSWGPTSAMTREILSLESNPFKLDRGALLANWSGDNKEWFGSL